MPSWFSVCPSGWQLAWILASIPDCSHYFLPACQCPSVSLHACQSVCLSMCLSIHLYVSPSDSLSVSRSIGPSVHLSVCLSFSLSARLFTWLSTCLNAYLSLCLCLSFNPSVFPSLCGESVCLSMLNPSTISKVPQADRDSRLWNRSNPYIPVSTVCLVRNA